MAEYDRHLLDGEHLGHLISKIKSLVATKITNPATKSNGQVLQYNGTDWVATTLSPSGVSSVTAATGETVVVVDNTDSANPKLGVAICATPGNVALTKESDGLKANIASLSADVVVDGTTNKAYTATEKTKLAGIAAGAEVNVNADWNAVSGDAQILNKPTLGTAAAKDFTTAITAGSNDLVTSGAVQSAIAGLTGFHFEIVQTLPATGETNVIYLVPKTSGPQTNIYTEYAWINNAWEQLGDTQISLEYLTNAEIDTIWNAAV